MIEVYKTQEINNDLLCDLITDVLIEKFLVKIVSNTLALRTLGLKYLLVSL